MNEFRDWTHMMDEILILAVLIMLCASISLGLAVRLSLRHSKKTFEALIEEIDGMRLAALDLDEEVTRLKHRVVELEHEQ